MQMNLSPIYVCILGYSLQRFQLLRLIQDLVRFMNKITVDINGGGDYTTVGEALSSIKDDNETEIFIKKGIYKEKIIIDKPNLKFIGEDAEKTIITYDDGANHIDLETGEPMGTFKTATFHILRCGENFSAYNITFENSAGMGDVAGQAVAVYVDCDKAAFKKCRFKARQDTLLTAPMHEDIKREPERLNRQYFEECYIEGDVDFIFGGATAVFKNCKICGLDRGKEVNGYYTAACTAENIKFGYVFMDCKFTTDSAGKGTYFLGRPWREFAKTVFLNCHMGGHINKESFSKWKNFEKRSETCYYAQYKSLGEGFDENCTAKWTYILSDDEAKDYTIENIFGDWNPAATMKP